jgi:hypothetical protein
MFRENANTNFILSDLFRKSCRLGDNVEKYSRIRQATDNDKIRRKRSAGWIKKATDTH